MLGPVELSSSGRQLALGTPKQKAVLTLLLARAGTVITVEDLIDELWEGEPPASAVANVRQYANTLRRLLADQGGAPVLDRLGQGYRLTVDPATFDLSRFRDLTTSGRDALAAGDADSAVTFFDEGLGLWRGRPAADVTAGGWLTGWRTALQEERWSAVEDRAEALLALGRAEHVSTQLRDLLSAEPMRERGHALLVRARYQAGDVAGALASVEAARRVLADELGVEPGPELAELQQAVLRRDPALTVPPQRAVASAPPRPAAPAMEIVVPRQLPRDVTGFVGRAIHLRRLDSLLPDPSGGLPAGVVVVSAIAGTAGVARPLWRCTGRTGWPTGSPMVSSTSTCAASTWRRARWRPPRRCAGFLDAYGVPPGRVPAGLDAQVALYRSLLAGRRVLVVLDNARSAEQVRPAAARVAGLSGRGDQPGRADLPGRHRRGPSAVAGRAARSRGAATAGPASGCQAGGRGAGGGGGRSSRPAPACRWRWASRPPGPSRQISRWPASPPSWGPPAGGWTRWTPGTPPARYGRCSPGRTTR